MKSGTTQQHLPSPPPPTHLSTPLVTTAGYNVLKASRQVVTSECGERPFPQEHSQRRHEVTSVDSHPTATTAARPASCCLNRRLDQPVAHKHAVESERDVPPPASSSFSDPVPGKGCDACECRPKPKLKSASRETASVVEVQSVRVALVGEGTRFGRCVVVVVVVVVISVVAVVVPASMTSMSIIATSTPDILYGEFVLSLFSS